MKPRAGRMYEIYKGIFCPSFPAIMTYGLSSVKVNPYLYLLFLLRSAVMQNL